MIVLRRSASDFSNSRSLLVERPKARLRRVDIGFDVADFCRSVDQLLIEFSPVVAQGVDFAFKLGLAFRRAALVRQRRVQLLVALLECVGIGGRLCIIWPRRCRAVLPGRRLRRWKLGRCGLCEGCRNGSEFRPVWQRKYQDRPEHKPGFGSELPAENHRFQARQEPREGKNKLNKWRSKHLQKVPGKSPARTRQEHCGMDGE